MTNEKTQMRIIWFALTMSIVIYAVIAYVIVPMGTQPFDAAFSNPVILALHVAGLGMFATSFVMRLPIVRWAMIESAAVFGLLAAFITQDLRLFFPLGALAIAGMLMAYPRD